MRKYKNENEKKLLNNLYNLSHTVMSLRNLNCITNEWRSRSYKTNDLLNQKRKIQCKKQIIFICINIMLLLPIRSFIKGRLSGSLSFVIKIINIEVWCKEKNAKI